MATEHYVNILLFYLVLCFLFLEQDECVQSILHLLRTECLSFVLMKEMRSQLVDFCLIIWNSEAFLFIVVV